MAAPELKDALQDANEIEITVTGRKSGREITLPIWFVEDRERLLLLPIHGTDTGWYRNAVKTPEIKLAAGGAELRTTAKPIEDPAGVADVVQKFGEKFGADRVEEYYPNENAALEVPLN
jgi:hypothetical protein